MPIVPALGKVAVMVAGVTAGVFMVGGERHIVTTRAIAITAAIGADASGRAGKSVQLCD
jgi:hypothetical protein